MREAVAVGRLYFFPCMKTHADAFASPIVAEAELESAGEEELHSVRVLEHVRRGEGGHCLNIVANIGQQLQVDAASERDSKGRKKTLCRRRVRVSVRCHRPRSSCG